MKDTITRETVIELVQQNDFGVIPTHDCNICNEPVGYVICINEDLSFSLGYDGNCGCTSIRTRLQPRSTQDLVDWYNMQTSDENRYSVIRAIAGKELPNYEE